jgi:competence protein ComEC
VKVFNIGYPEGVADDNENNRSIVLKWTFGDVDFLTTGDAEQPVEAKIMQQFGDELRCEVLKIDHHGSSDGTTESWMARVSPMFAVIPVARDNPYGHPHEESLDALHNHNVEILRTDLNGTVDFVTDGQSVIEAWY